MVTRYALERTVAPTSEPVSLAQLKSHCRVDIDEDDALLSEFLEDARDQAEDFVGQAFVTQTWKLYLDCFPSWEILVPKPPLQSVSSITYVDTAGDSQTLSSSLYQVDAKGQPGRIAPAYGQSWPSTRDQMNAVTITFVAGYGAASAVPGKIRQALRLTVGDWYANREQIITGTIVAELPTGAQRLLMAAWHGDI